MVAEPEAVVRLTRELRRFRHFFRNAYVLDLDPVRVRERTADLLAIGSPVAAGLAAAEAHVHAALLKLTAG